MCEKWGNLEDGSCEDVIGRGSHDRRLGLRPAHALGLFEHHAVSNWPKPSKLDSSDVRQSQAIAVLAALLTFVNSLSPPGKQAGESTDDTQVPV